MIGDEFGRLRAEPRPEDVRRTASFTVSPVAELVDVIVTGIDAVGITLADRFPAAETC